MMSVKKVVAVLSVFIFVQAFSQTKSLKRSPVKTSRVAVPVKTTVKKPADVVILNEDVPVLIPQKKDGKFGYINQKGKFIIQPEYHIAIFFAEDCNLLNSPNEKVKKFGTKEYATVEKDNISYRINQSGKKVYQYKDSDLGRCKSEFKQQLYHAYIMNGFYGIIEDAVFQNPADYRQYQIYPQFQYLHILEGDDLRNPMIIASQNDRFGIIDVNGKVIIPFEYSDIKRNFSWKLGKMFEVTKDGKSYYYIDTHNKAY